MKQEGIKMFRKFYILVTVVICLFILGGCMGRTGLTKDQITQLVNDNLELLNNAVLEIYNLDESIFLIANTRFRNPPVDVDFRGLYTSGTIDGRNVVKPLDSPVLHELLKDGRIISISIRRADGEINQIVFGCRGRGIFDRYKGFYFSPNNEPFWSDRTLWINPQPKGNGWVIDGERTYFYTEKIVDYWYYFELLSNR